MANEQLAQQLQALKGRLEEYNKLLEKFKTWALANDGVIDAAEQQQIDRISADIAAIKARIAQIEKAKGLNQQQQEQNQGQPQASAQASAKGNELANSGKYAPGIAGPGGYWVPKDKECIPAALRGKKFNPGEKIPQEVLNCVSVTWCNRFAMDLVEEVLGDDNPFKKLIADKGGKGMVGAGTMLKYMDEEKGKLFDEVTELEKAWEHINAGKMVFFSTSDHIATGVPTAAAEMKQSTSKSGRVFRYGKIVQAGAKVGTMYINEAWGVERLGQVKIFVSKKNGQGGATTSPTEEGRPENGSPTPTNPPTTPTSDSSISGSVGKGGDNNPTDVFLVKKLLNQKINAGLTEDNPNVATKTIEMIEKFQREVVGLAKPDGKIDPGGRTWKALIAGTTVTPPANEGGNGQANPEENNSSSPPIAEVEEALSANSKITQSVGQGGKNEAADVLRVKQLLNKFGYNLPEDGTANAALNDAIKDFQRKYRGATNPDGRVDPNGGTWGTLIGIGRIQGQLLSMSQQYGVEPAVILAIQQIESGGNGFLADGRPKILFEGHVFWRQLTAAGKNPQNFVRGNEDILYPSWDKTKYQGGAKEYDRLERAKRIDEIAALKSASWGEFQIMGFNHATVGYPDVKTFVDAMHVPNGASLKAVMEFCKNKNLLRHVQSANKNWAKFAEGYNGSGYAQNQYDVKLAAAYERFKRALG